MDKDYIVMMGILIVVAFTGLSSIIFAEPQQTSCSRYYNQLDSYNRELISIGIELRMKNIAFSSKEWREYNLQVKTINHKLMLLKDNYEWC